MAPRGDCWPRTCGRRKMGDIRLAGLTTMVNSLFQGDECDERGLLDPAYFVIAGTGRAGTSLLVKILHACGLETKPDRKLAAASGGALR
jgi:hypothetical protein